MLTCVLPALLLCASCTLINENGSGWSTDDWTVYRGAPSLCGYTECALPGEPQLLWSATTQTRTEAAPIVYDGYVYTLDRKGCLRRFSTEGDSVLIHDFKTLVEASFVVADSVLYVGRIDGHVNAFDLNSHALLWDFETMGQISGSPNLAGGQLLVGSYDGSLYTLDAKTGKKVSQYETAYYINGTAAVAEGVMLFGGCDAWLRVVDIATGVMTDSLELDSYVPASPAIVDGVACVSDYNGNLYEITLDKGKITSHRKLMASDADNSDADGGVVAMPTLTRSDVYVLSGERSVSCIKRSSGQLRWQKLLRGITGVCAPLVARDKVLVCTKDGHVSIFSAKDGTELWHFETGEPIVASPAIVADCFYVLTTRGTLFCFGKNTL